LDLWVTYLALNGTRWGLLSGNLRQVQGQKTFCSSKFGFVQPLTGIFKERKLHRWDAGDFSSLERSAQWQFGDSVFSAEI